VTALAVLGMPVVTQAKPLTERISVDGAGREGNYFSVAPAINLDGRLVVFMSVASNLVSGDTNGTNDVFVRDRQTGVTERVSVGSAGQQGDDTSFEPAISGDGRFVAFASFASNLVAGDTNGSIDVFVHDRVTNVTERVSVDSAGREGGSSSDRPAISGDGRFVAFESSASNLVADDTNDTGDIFVHDRLTGRTERVSVDSAGAQANFDSMDPAISADGRFVAFTSFASNLVPGDTNGSDGICMGEVFVHDRQTGITERVSIDSTGQPGNGSSVLPAISADGRFVAFWSSANNLVTGDTNEADDIFVHDRRTGVTERISVDSAGQQGNGASMFPAISGKGRFVSFMSSASNLVGDDTNGQYDVFVHDRQTGGTKRVSVSSSGQQGDLPSFGSAISGDGRVVGFESAASDLVPADDNCADDVFVCSR
jgi:WD40 repeat protein